MTSKTTVLIAGANTGLGYEIVKALAQSSTAYKIFVGSRSVSNGDEAIKLLKSAVPNTTSEFETVQIDISKDESIESAFDHVKKVESKIDVLINNAGVSLDHAVTDGSMTARKAWNEMWDVNVTGTWICTNTFAPLLLASAKPRLIFITSGTSSIEEAMKGMPWSAAKPPAGWPKPPAWGFSGYRSSKAGMNMMVAEFVRIFKEDGVIIHLISPGFLATGLAGQGKEKLAAMGARHPSVGAEVIRTVVEGAKDADANKVIRGDHIQPW